MADLFASLLIVGALAMLTSLFVPTLRPLVARHGLSIAAVLAVAATSGSLYFSEGAGFNPCELCWVQRIFMYPLAVVLPIASIRRDRSLIPYAMVLAVVGLGVSIHHVRLQLFPGDATSCDLLNPCSSKWVEALGFATIPMMAGTSFAMILIALGARIRSKA